MISKLGMYITLRTFVLSFMIPEILWKKTIFLSLPFGVFSECKVASWQHEYKLSSWDQGGRANWTVILYWYLKFYNHVFLFVHSKTLRTFIDFNWLVNLVECLNISSFQPLILIYRRGNFVCHHWGCTFIYRPLPYPFGTLALSHIIGV